MSIVNIRAKRALPHNPFYLYCRLVVQLRYNSVHFDERKAGCLFPKRHQIKHLDLDLPLVREQGVGGSNPLSPTN